MARMGDDMAKSGVAGETQVRVGRSWQVILTLPIDLLVILSVGAVFVWTALLADNRLFNGSGYSHFVALADSFLHGRLTVPPQRYHDVSFWEGRWYIAFPPLPAVLLMPMVAILGVDATVRYDVIFSIVVGVLGLAAVRGMLGSLGVTMHARWAMVVLFGLGTVYWSAVVSGAVWFVAHVVAIVFLAPYIGESVGQKRPVLAGAALALASWARTTTLLGAVFYVVLVLYDVRRGHLTREAAMRKLALFLAVLTISVALMLGYNYVRFGSALNFGYDTMRIGAALSEDYERYGQFHLHYVPRNLYHMLLGSYAPVAAPNRYEPNPWGMSIFLTTPLLFYIFRAPIRDTVNVAAWLSVLVIAVPLMLYYNTGWVQWGYRFALDFMPFLLVLAASGMGRRLSWGSATLIAASIIINFLGVRWFFKY